MKLNIEKSLELKKQFKHKVGNCYRNAVNLYLDKKVADEYIIGYCSTNNGKHFFRHAWNVLDGKIIDSTLKDFSENIIYEPIHVLNHDNFHVAMMSTSGPAMLELDVEAEWAVQEKLREEYGTIPFYN